jgi:Methyltransferase domain
MLATEVEYGITARECQVMFDLLARQQPEYTAEIGCANGASTLAIAQALEHQAHGHHFAVDPFQSTRWKDAGKHRISAADLSHRVTFHDNYPERIFHTLPKLDFVFIDGSHLFDLTVMDFVVSDRRLKIGGLMAFHDKWMPAICNVIRFILANRSYEPFCTGRANPPVTSWQKLRTRAALQFARLIAGDRRLVSRRFPFDNLGLDIETNLVFIRKIADDRRDWRFFSEF